MKAEVVALTKLALMMLDDADCGGSAAACHLQAALDALQDRRSPVQADDAHFTFELVH